MQPALEIFLKNFLRRAAEHIPSNSLSLKLNNVISTAQSTMQAGCITRIPLHYIKNYTPMFEHGP